MHPWRSAVDAAGRGRRCNTHTAEEGMQRNLDAGSELRDHFLAIKRDDLRSTIGVLVRQKTASSAESIAGPGSIDIDFLNLNFENVPGFGFGNFERTGEDVAAWTLVFHLAINGCVVGRNVRGRDTLFDEALIRAAGGKRLDTDRVAGMNREHRLGFGGIVSPDNGGRRGQQRGWRGRPGADGCEQECCFYSNEISHRVLPDRPVRSELKSKLENAQ